MPRFCFCHVELLNIYNTAPNKATVGKGKGITQMAGISNAWPSHCICCCLSAGTCWWCRKQQPKRLPANSWPEAMPWWRGPLPACRSTQTPTWCRKILHRPECNKETSADSAAFNFYFFYLQLYIATRTVKYLHCSWDEVTWHELYKSYAC